MPTFIATEQNFRDCGENPVSDLRVEATRPVLAATYHDRRNLLQSASQGFQSECLKKEARCRLIGRTNVRLQNVR